MKCFERFFRCESGQASTEYILLLFAALSFFLIVWKQLMEPLYERLKATLISRFEDSLFDQANFHRFPLRRN